MMRLTEWSGVFCAGSVRPDNMAAVNDLSEDMRKEIDNIYQAIAELSVRPVASEKPRKKIGFKTNSDE